MEHGKSRQDTPRRPFIREQRPVEARSGRRRNDRGAVLVEAAFILPILMLVTFGIIEFGMAYGNASTTKSSTRSGARLASTEYAVLSDKSQAISDISNAVRVDLTSLSRGTPVEMWIYQAGSNGHPTGDTNFTVCSTNCIALTWNTGTKAWNTSTGSWANPDACGTTIDNVGVYVKINHSYTSGFFGSTLVIKQFTVMRLEPLTLAQCGS